MSIRHSISKAIGRLLKKNISKSQLIGYSIANLVGLTIILCGILFYCDSRRQAEKSDKFFSEDYIVISKQVKGLNLSPIAFTEEEIQDIEKQDWVKKVGRFTSADFSVSASINMGGKGMSTYLFFESVPDDFFDILPSGWDYKPGQPFIPIMLNKDYLALYNFGFAIPQGLPQLSEEMIATVPLKLLISGKNGKKQIFDASVVGFSSRLNTISVPQQFMEWANEEFGQEDNIGTSRLILKIDKLNPGDSQNYFKQHGIEVSGDKANDSKVSEFMALISGVISATGVVISLLAIFIMVLSISLLLQKSRHMLHQLLLLGYNPKIITSYYRKRVFILNAIISGCAIGLTFICRLIWHKPLISLGLGHGNVLFMIGAALIYFLIISIINSIVVKRHILLIWRNR